MPVPHYRIHLPNERLSTDELLILFMYKLIKLFIVMSMCATLATVRLVALTDQTFRTINLMTYDFGCWFGIMLILYGMLWRFFGLRPSFVNEDRLSQRWRNTPMVRPSYATTNPKPMRHRRSMHQSRQSANQGDQRRRM